MLRFFQLLLTAMAMLAVAMVAAFATMRLAIHGREVEVPDLHGFTLAEASDRAARLGLSLRLENRFYSTEVPSGHLLNQFPAPGVTVRRQWTVRVTESLGAQQVSIPDVVGQPERPATLALRRASLNVGAIADIAAPGDPGVVLAQTPPPNAEGVDRPRVSLLVSQTSASVPEAFVMPQLTGLSLFSANGRAAASGLRIVVVEAPSVPIQPATPAYHDSYFAGQTPSSPAPSPPSTPGISPSAVVVSQSPQSGTRVLRGEAVRLKFGS